MQTDRPGSVRRPRPTLSVAMPDGTRRDFAWHDVAALVLERNNLRQDLAELRAAQAAARQA